MLFSNGNSRKCVNVIALKVSELRIENLVLWFASQGEIYQMHFDVLVYVFI